MLELVRGYAAGLFDDAAAAGQLPDVVAGLRMLSSLLVSSELLRGAVTDASIDAASRGAVLDDLLSSRAPAGLAEVATFAVQYDRAGELPRIFEQLLEAAEERTQRAEGGDLTPAEPPIGRSGGLERLRGFAERIFEQLSDQNLVDEIEDELFRFARIAEASPELRDAVSSLPPEAGLAFLSDLLGARVRPETLRLLGYVLRTGRGRDLVGSANYLVELAAAERGRRVAAVRSAVELNEGELQRLAEALTRRMRRPVELRVVRDPSVLGGLDIEVGDTVIDGTLRHRLEQLRESLLTSP